jgi:hypothetical protein
VREASRRTTDCSCRRFDLQVIDDITELSVLFEFIHELLNSIAF